MQTSLLSGALPRSPECLKKLTVADLLTQPNPEFAEAQPVYRELGKIRGSSRNSKIWPSPKTLRKWRDFDRNNLDRAFNGSVKAVLEQHVNIDQTSELLNLGPQGFNGEESLRSVLDITHRAIVNRALKVSSQRVINQDLEMLRGDGATLYLLTSRNARKAWPDWVVRSSEYAKHCILPGETKTSWVWRSADLRKCVDANGVVISSSAEALGPVKQLAYYCVLSFARYGFMITDKELVVIRISCNRHLDLPKTAIQEWKEHVEDNLAIEYESIPWHHPPGDTRVMTMNLALWFLHLLAGNNGQLCVSSRVPTGEESLVGHEQKVPFDDKLVDSQSQSQPSQASLYNEELTYATDAPMGDPDSLTIPSFEEDTVLPVYATQQEGQGSTRSRGSNAQGSFTSRTDGRRAHSAGRSVLSPKESNTRIQKRRKASLRSKKGVE